jgi:hypothetical protein
VTAPQPTNPPTLWWSRSRAAVSGNGVVRQIRGHLVGFTAQEQPVAALPDDAVRLIPVDPTDADTRADRNDLAAVAEAIGSKAWTTASLLRDVHELHAVRNRLESELARVTRERDEARAERDALTREVAQQTMRADGWETAVGAQDEEIHRLRAQLTFPADRSALIEWVRDAARGADPLTARCKDCGAVAGEACSVQRSPREGMDGTTTTIRRGRPPHDGRRFTAYFESIATALLGTTTEATDAQPS